MLQKQIYDIAFKKKALRGGSNPQADQPPDNNNNNNNDRFRPPNLNTNNAVQDAQRNFQLRSELTSLRWQLRSQPTNQGIINRIAAIEQELQIIVPGNPQGER